MPVKDRVIAAVPYLIPMCDGLKYGMQYQRFQRASVCDCAISTAPARALQSCQLFRILVGTFGGNALACSLFLPVRQEPRTQFCGRTLSN
jgi:hypothetical protein